MGISLGGPAVAALPSAESGVVLQVALDVLSNLPLVLVVAGIALMIAEALAPGAHFIVLGVALLFAGLLGLLLGPVWGILSGVALAVVLAASVLGLGAGALYTYREFDFYGGKGMGRTSDSDSLRGKNGRVTQRVTPTEGEVKLDDGGFAPHYAARSMDGEIAEGEEVMVIDPGGGNVVTVESLSAVEGDIDRELARGRERERAEEQRNERTDAERETT